MVKSLDPPSKPDDRLTGKSADPINSSDLPSTGKPLNIWSTPLFLWTNPSIFCNIQILLLTDKSMYPVSKPDSSLTGDKLIS